MEKKTRVSLQREMEMKFCWLQGYQQGLADGQEQIRKMISVMFEIQKPDVQQRIIKSVKKMGMIRMDEHGNVYQVPKEEEKDEKEQDK